MLIAGLALAGYGVVAYRRGLSRYASASTGWRQGVATIDQSWLEEVVSRSNEGDTTSYRARVAYRYPVDGAERHGTKPFLCARVNFRSYKAGQAWLAGVPAGASVPVWYDPARPDDATIDLNRPSLSLILVLGMVGLGLAAMGLFLLASH